MPALMHAPDLWPKDIPRTTTFPMLRKAVRMWAQGANNTQIAQWMNVPPQAVPRLLESDGWRNTALALRKDLDFDLESAFGRLGFKALDQLEDRLRYGDYYINKHGERARRPLHAEQLAKITAILIDRRAEVRHLVDGTESEKTKERKSDLATIADLLRDHANSAYHRAAPAKIIDVEPSPAQPSEAPHALDQVAQ